MNIETTIDKTINILISKDEEMQLRFNDEYQRAAAWNTLQKQMFIDSVLRKYSIPAFYFHFTSTKIPAISKKEIKEFDVIDGQQRIRALREFRAGAFALLDPKESSFKFPNFVQGKPCGWAGKTFSELEEEDKKRLRDTKIVIYEIKTGNSDEVRDLFIRLQGGTPLSAQDKRDAWPGKFTEYILNMAGKEALNPEDGNAGKIGWQFFRAVIGINKGSRKRQLAAQLVMIFIEQKRDKKKSFGSIKSQNIDYFYHKNIDFDKNSDVARDFQKVLEKLTLVLDKKVKKLVGHEAIHLVLLTDLLMTDYATGWESHLAGAHIKFRERVLLANEAAKDNEKSDYDMYWKWYSRWTQTSSDEGSNIEIRHKFFLGEMLNILSSDLTKKDPNRIFTDLQRTIIYRRDKKECQWCRLKEKKPHEVSWDEMEIHHVIPHHQGGQTDLSNGALMHKDCHPKSEDGTNAFNQWWEKKKDTTDNTDEQSINGNSKNWCKFKNIPNSTECRFFFAKTEYSGKITDGKLFVDGFERGFTSFSGASKAITESSRNGWVDWEIRLHDENEWTLADHWRQQLR